MNGRAGPVGTAWIAAAQTSLPVPLSPVMNTGAREGADRADLVVDLEHRRRAADEAVKSGRRLDADLLGGEAFAPGRPASALPDRAQQPSLVERLDEEVEGARAHRLDGTVDRPGAVMTIIRRLRRLAVKRRQRSRPSPSGSCRSRSTRRGSRVIAVARAPRRGCRRRSTPWPAGSAPTCRPSRATGCPRPGGCDRRTPAPQAASRRLVRKGRRRIDLGDAAAHFGGDSSSRAIVRSWTWPFSDRTQACSRTAPNAPATEIRICDAAVDRPRSSGAEATPLQRRTAVEQVGDHLLQEFADHVDADRSAEAVEDARVITDARRAGPSGRAALRCPAPMREVRQQARAPAPRRW